MGWLIGYASIGFAFASAVVFMVLAEGDEPRIGPMICCALFWPAVAAGCIVAAVRNK